jgi:hypothetical protein
MGLKQWFNRTILNKPEEKSKELSRIYKNTTLPPEVTQCDFCKASGVCSLGKEPSCSLKDPEFSYLKDIVEEINIDPNKDTIVLLDDNAGVLSFLIDDLKLLKKKGIFDYTKYNVLTFDSKFAAFKLRSALYTRQNMNIKFAIFDITIGGTLFTESGENICLDGVDCFTDVSKYYDDFKYIFYTGNKLNTYINKNQEIVDKFKNFTGDDIEDHILYKTSLTREERWDYLADFFTEDTKNSNEK